MLFPTVILLTVTNSGCSDHTKRQWRHQSAEDNYRLALEAEHPDIRRDAVTRIAESGYVTDDDSFSVLDAVARTDPASQIRCVAIKAFCRYDDSRPVGPLLSILQAGPDSQEAKPPDNDVRWEAATALAAFQRQGLVPEEHGQTAQNLFIAMSARGQPRNVRLAALEALGTFQDREVFPPLINALHESDFALADQAERSLIALTGVTHDYDGDAWEQWLSVTQEPFAHAGEKPVTTRPAGPTWWDRQTRKWRKTFKLQNN